MPDPREYTVGWISALVTELVAAQAFLDKKHEPPPGMPRDNNIYALGSIGNHNVVIAVLPKGEYGTDSAAAVARDMLRTFVNVRIGLMVGIGGGVPTAKHDIRLGDVVVGSPGHGRGGIFQYEFGKALQSGEFEQTRHLDQPPTILLTAIASLEAAYILEGHRLLENIEKALKHVRRPQAFMRPLKTSDRLYKPKVVHTPASAPDCEACESNGDSRVTCMDRDPERQDDPAIHYGLIASANKLIRDARLRDRLSKTDDVLCFETEAAGLVNHFPCLVIRGICDYSDSHKNKEWQGFAAMMAAAYAKDVLLQIPPERVEQERQITKVLENIVHQDGNKTRSEIENMRFEHTNLLAGIRQDMQGLSLQTAVEDVSTALERHHVLPFDDDPDFVDRPDIWEWMTQRYSASGHVSMALVGIGGIGKSQLAIRFGNWVEKHSPNTSVFWVRASTKATFEESYRQIADVLKVPGRNDPEQDVLALLSNWLQREDVPPWLMIIDNADDSKIIFAHDGTSAKDDWSISSHLARTRNGKILVTSRNQDVAVNLVGPNGIFHVQEMEPSQACQLFQTKLAQDYDGDDCLNLIHALGNIPLAVTQAAAYIRMQRSRVTVLSYLDQLRQGENKMLRLLEIDKGDIRRYNGACNSVVVTWQMTFNQIRQERPNAANLLCLMSMFQPQNIPEKMLHGYSNGGHSQQPGSDDSQDQEAENERLEDDLDTLHSYSLISWESDFWHMHSLVQFCTRMWTLKSADEKHWNSLFVQLASLEFPSGTFETWEECRVLLPHVQPLANTKPSEKGVLLSWSELLTNMSWYYLMLGEYERAEKVVEAATEARKELLGRDHPDTLISMANLASTFWNQSRWDKAEELQVEVMKASKIKLGRDHPDTLTSMANLAATFWNQDRWGKAEELQVEVMEASKIKLGRDHPHTLTSMANLAATYRKQGRWGKAEALGLEVMEASKIKLGRDHPSTLTSMANLAATYRDQSRWGKAEELEVEVMEASKIKLGRDHPHTLTSMNNLAHTWESMEKSSEAEELFIEVIEARKAKLGPDHPDTLRSIANLAATYGNQGRWDEAEELELEVMKASRTKLGPDHPHTLTSMNNLACTWKSMGKNSEAIGLMLIYGLSKQLD